MRIVSPEMPSVFPTEYRRRCVDLSISRCWPRSPSTAWPRAMYSSSAECVLAKNCCSRSACASLAASPLPSPSPEPNPPLPASAMLVVLACPAPLLPSPYPDAAVAVAELAYGFSGVAAANGRRPSSSARLSAWAASSRAALSASSRARKSASSARKSRIRSKAFSCLAGLSSCLASALYSSMVRAKAVSDAESEPSAAGVMV